MAARSSRPVRLGLSSRRGHVLAIGRRGAPEAGWGADRGQGRPHRRRRRASHDAPGWRRLRVRRTRPDSGLEDGRRRRAASSASRAPEGSMADLRTNFLGVKSPNPFWLAPPPSKVNVSAFRAGWGGVVWSAGRSRAAGRQRVRRALYASWTRPPDRDEQHRAATAILTCRKSRRRSSAPGGPRAPSVADGSLR